MVAPHHRHSTNNSGWRELAVERVLKEESWLLESYGARRLTWADNRSTAPTNVDISMGLKFGARTRGWKREAEGCRVTQWYETKHPRSNRNGVGYQWSLAPWWKMDFVFQTLTHPLAFLWQNRIFQVLHAVYKPSKEHHYPVNRPVNVLTFPL